ncbi:MAG TPA: TM0106 family RecB-like putative nuclease [Acidimicrobiales bacterium]|nr:TM0106 family RecB-like putative nuclease [Acidimicrobiales bacterium]
MFLLDGSPVFSASDLSGFLACGHLPILDRRALAGELPRPPAPEPLSARYGDRHEAAYLARLRDAGRRVAELDRPDVGSRDSLLDAQARTVAALAAGYDVVYQGTFFDGAWLGHPDFLVRTDRPSALGPFRYDVVDTKLARHARATALLQVALYGHLLAPLQGADPDQLVLALGDGTDRRFPYVAVAAYLRATMARFTAALDAPPPYPYPVDHCALCRWDPACRDRRRADDHLSLVAGIRRQQVDRLERAGIATVAALAAAPAEPPAGAAIGDGPFRRLHRQAAQQVRSRTDGVLSWELLPAAGWPAGEHAAGGPAGEHSGGGHSLAALPEPDDGDLFFDLEGFPYADDGGLEYLFGWVDATGTYHHLFADDRAGERLAFEQFMDHLADRRRRHPGLHVYHYAPYERSALSRLSNRHGVREEQVADLLRDGVLVDLYQVVRHSLVVGAESYSIKDLEPLYGLRRTGDVRTADDSLAMYQQWLDSDPPDDALRQRIADYNEVDCRSTLALRGWLLGVRQATARGAGGGGDGAAGDGAGGVDRGGAGGGEDAGVDGAGGGEDGGRLAEGDGQPARAGREAGADGSGAVGTRLADWLADAEAAAAALWEGVPDDPADRDADQHGRAMLGHLLKFHHREAAAEWRDRFARLELPVDDLVEDRAAVAGLRYDGPGPRVKQSQDHRYSFPAQDVGLRVGDRPTDPATGGSPGRLVALHAADRSGRGTLTLRRGVAADPPHPYALIPGAPVPDYVLRYALLRMARWVVDHGLGSALPTWRAGRQLLLRRPPRLAGGDGDGRLARPGEHGSDALQRLAGRLDGAALPVQGPPGSGKTYSAARVIVDAVRAGKRVGVTANSHRVIDHLLAAAVAQAPELRVVHKADPDDPAVPGVANVASNREVVALLDRGQVDVVGATAWLLGREEMAGRLDLLVVDEAGQVSLANALASMAAATDAVLVGDPAQLDQPVQAAHPDGTDVSALGHVIGPAPTMPDHLGLFLDQTRRMHPAVCAFVSEVAYDGKLVPVDGLDRQAVDGEGSGLRWLAVPHHGNRTSSADEADAVDRAVRSVLGRQWTDAAGARRPLLPADVLVVTPYNAHIAALRARLPDGVEAGTVDRFQGREAPVVFYSMATSTADDLPRDFEFLFSLNRLNVAVSRARGLAVLACSPALLAPRCRTTRQVQLANALCRFVECAQPFGGG